MTRVRVSTSIPAPPEDVWAEIGDIASHVEWMDDAVAIRFTSPTRRGVGTTFDCDTRIGPFSLTDRMEVTDWREGHSIDIRHVGLVTGTGRLAIRRRMRGGTRVTWEERLVFPRKFGGPLGAAIAGVVLRRVWRRNLANLRRRVAA